MGTNYYRIASEEEMVKRKSLLKERLETLEMTASNIESGFCTLESPYSPWDRLSAWDEFTHGTRLHLGKRSSGWKFLWNFNDKKHYSSKEELLTFIRSGRVVNEYGEELDPEEFIEMALAWGQEDGLDIQDYHKENPVPHYMSSDSSKYEYYLDGLRVSTSTDFS